MKRNTLKVLVVALLWSMGFSFSWLFIGVYIYQISSNLLLSTLFYSIPQTAWIIGSIIWGVLSDVKFRRKMILGVSSILFGLFLVPFIFIRNPLLLIIFFTTAWFIGSLSSGFIYENLSPTILFVFSSAFIIVAGLISFTLKEGKKVITKDNVSHFQVYLTLLKKPIIGVTCIVGFILYVAQNLISSVFSVYFVNGLGGTPTLYSIASAGAAGLGIFASFTLGHLSEKKWFGRAGAIFYSIIGYIIFYLMILTKDLFIVAIGWALPFYAGIMIGGPAFVSDHSEKDKRSRGMALFDMFSSVGSTLGYIFASLVIFFLMLSDIIQTMILLTILGIFATLLAFVIFVIGLKIILNKKQQ